jgi:hypothetical protein
MAAVPAAAVSAALAEEVMITIRTSATVESGTEYAVDRTFEEGDFTSFEAFLDAGGRGLLHCLYDFLDGKELWPGLLATVEQRKDPSR